MRRLLFFVHGLVILGLPIAQAESPFSGRDSDLESLSSMSASPDGPTTFDLRFVALLSGDDSLGLIDVDDQNATTDERVREAVNSASPNNSQNDIGLEDTPLSDDTRLTARLAELNKPASLLSVALPPATAGEVPVNQGAEIFDQTPYWIAGGPSLPPRAKRVHIAFYHNPTYYQELNLERCGRLDCASCGYLQNLYSSVWFVGNTSLLPFRLAAQPPCQCVTSYGDCPTCHQYNCPVEPLQPGNNCAATSRGVLSQSAALAGFVLLLW